MVFWPEKKPGVADLKLGMYYNFILGITWDFSHLSHLALAIASFPCVMLSKLEMY